MLLVQVEIPVQNRIYSPLVVLAQGAVAVHVRLVVRIGCEYVLGPAPHLLVVLGEARIVERLDRKEWICRVLSRQL